AFCVPLGRGTDADKSGRTLQSARSKLPVFLKHRPRGLRRQLVSAALRGSGCADGSCQPLVDENRHFDAAVLLAAFTRRVIGHGFKFAKSERIDHAVERNVVILSQVPPHSFGATLTELAVF